MFNVQEHLFNLADIEAALTQLGLSFCGFEDERANRRFAERALSTRKNTILVSGRFLKKNPKIFAGMYQFWCQKI